MAGCPYRHGRFPTVGGWAGPPGDRLTWRRLPFTRYDRHQGPQQHVNGGEIHSIGTHLETSRPPRHGARLGGWQSGALRLCQVEAKAGADKRCGYESIKSVILFRRSDRGNAGSWVWQQRYCAEFAKPDNSNHISTAPNQPVNSQKRDHQFCASKIITELSTFEGLLARDLRPFFCTDVAFGVVKIWFAIVIALWKPMQPMMDRPICWCNKFFSESCTAQLLFSVRAKRATRVEPPLRVWKLHTDQLVWVNGMAHWQHGYDIRKWI